MYNIICQISDNAVSWKIQKLFIKVGAVLTQNSLTKNTNEKSE